MSRLPFTHLLDCAHVANAGPLHNRSDAFIAAFNEGDFAKCASFYDTSARIESMSFGIWGKAKTQADRYEVNYMYPFKITRPGGEFIMQIWWCVGKVHVG